MTLTTGLYNRSKKTSLMDMTTQDLDSWLKGRPTHRRAEKEADPDGDVFIRLFERKGAAWPWRELDRDEVQL